MSRFAPDYENSNEAMRRFWNSRTGYDPTALEPPDPVTVCTCTECKQDVYLDECTFQDGLGNDLCAECFESMINRRMRHELSLFATELGYTVVRHEG